MGSEIYTLAPIEVFLDSRLRQKDMKVLAILYSYQIPLMGCAWPTLAELSRRTQMTQESLVEIIDRLDRWHWLHDCQPIRGEDGAWEMSYYLGVPERLWVEEAV